MYSCITWFGFAFTLFYNFLHFYTYWFVYGCGSSSRIPFQQQHQQSTHFSFYHVKVFQSQFRDKVKHSTLSQAAQSRIPGRFDKKLQTSAANGPQFGHAFFFEYTYMKVIFLVNSQYMSFGRVLVTLEKRHQKVTPHSTGRPKTNMVFEFERWDHPLFAVDKVSPNHSLTVQKPNEKHWLAKAAQWAANSKRHVWRNDAQNCLH